MEFSGTRNNPSWLEIPRGKELIAYFGHEPMFPDGEITQLELNRHATSTLSIHLRGLDNVDPVRQAVATRALTDIIDLQLENFGPQDVIGDLIIRPLQSLFDRASCYLRQQLPGDSEIELVSIYGLHGLIRGEWLSMSRANPGTSRRVASGTLSRETLRQTCACRA